jgi:hypothetical protein
LPYGIPYGVAVGNHDEDSGQGHSASDSTTLYNQFVGTNHFKPKSYYGGNYGADGDNFYDLFSASGMDFIVLYLQYDETMTSTDARLTWANNVLQTYSNRRAIVVSHWLLNDDASFGFQGANIYDALKGNTNLFLMLCGHISGWTRTSNVFNGNTIWTVLSDYQSLDSLNLDSTFASTLGNSSDNGDGWLRIYTFSPSNNVIHAQTYSPFLSAVTGVQTNMSDRDNEFNINYNMSGMWVSIATNSNVTSGSTTSAACPCLTPGTQYQWYVTVSDGQTTTKGPLWTFTATTNVAPVFQTVERTGSVISLAWGAIPGRKYQLQYSTDLSRNNWTSLGGANAATTSSMSATDSSGPDTQRFYRVVLLP